MGKKVKNVHLQHKHKKSQSTKFFFKHRSSIYFKFGAKKCRKTTRLFAVSAWPKSPLQFDFKKHENEWTDH